MVALARVGCTSFDEDLVEFQQFVSLRARAHGRREIRELLTVLARAEFVKHFAETVDIRVRRPGPLRRHESFRADVCERGIHARHQPNVRKLRNAAHKDDVGGFDVAVDESVPVQGAERIGELQAE